MSSVVEGWLWPRIPATVATSVPPAIIRLCKRQQPLLTKWVVAFRLCLFGFTYVTESLDRERVTNAMVKLGALAETHSFFRFRQALDQTLEDISGFWWEKPHTRLTRARET